MNLTSHPAAFPSQIIDVLRRLIPQGRVVDPFGGIGKLGTLGLDWEVTSVEIEPEWALQGYSNGCHSVIIGDSRFLPFPSNSIPAIATSPTYGNRMADSYAPDMTSKRSHATRRSYRICLGRDLNSANSGGMQWGEDYRKLHREVWAECYRVLMPDGALVINCKDHMRAGILQEVCEFHWQTLHTIGFKHTETVLVPIKGDMNTSRMRAKGIAVVDHEQVAKWLK